MFLSCGLIVAAVGCSGTRVQQGDAAGIWTPAPRVASLDAQDANQVETLLVAAFQLQTIAREALEAAMLIGTADLELTEARQAVVQAEQ
jgi:hypothetical protein